MPARPQHGRLALLLIATSVAPRLSWDQPDPRPPGLGETTGGPKHLCPHCDRRLSVNGKIFTCRKHGEVDPAKVDGPHEGDPA
jgi:hypothetical protein